MLTFVLGSIIVVLLTMLFMQNIRFSRKLNYSSPAPMPVKKKSARVAYLEPSVGVDSGDNLNVDSSAIFAADTDLTIEDEIEIKASATVSPAVEAITEATEQVERESFISLYIESSDNRPYNGYELLQSILSSGLRYGKHSIFHYYSNKMAKNEILFSLASALDPGTFDLPRMGAFSTKALTIVMDTAKHKDPLKVFEKMLHVAGQLSEDLGGRVLNAEKQVLTKEYVREICMRINVVENDKLNLDLFEHAEALV